ncbi:MAG: transposase [Prevotella sp.]|nr:transposase [Prevotella sp.]
MNCSENMAADEKDRFIQYLVDKVNSYELDKRATELAVEEFQSTFDSVSASLESLKKEMEEIKAELSEERSKRKKAEAKSRKLDQQLKYAQKNKFGDKRQNACKDERKDECADREDEKDKFDGTEGTVSTKSVQENPKEENPVKVKKERDTLNRPKKSTKFKDTEHQICMAHAMAKLAKAANPGGDKAALPFHDDLSLFYKLEDRYDEEGISPEERGRRRQSLETKEILIRLRSRLDMELAKDETERSPYLTEALNYLDKFWDGIFAYQKDGNYPIDNDIAERTIRKLTTQRNNSLHYGSDEGVEMAVAYHSVISTVKLHGMSCWRYLGEFFKKIFNGCRDFFSLTPANIGMAYAKYRANEHKVKLACLYRVQPIFIK